ncbi:hypothetical protein SHKM778_14910 [Streptomyces sp. KM77-8]|uniref:Integral membrane protein n=1 Tax=Streptomyces haneummycinicus TaxID=3074435 RepID=A0AAT9HCS5_9ACTN
MNDLGTLHHSTPPGAADPVKALLHRHRDLCEQAVDPWRSRRAWRPTASPTAPRPASATATCSPSPRSSTPACPATTPPGARPAHDDPRTGAAWTVLALLPGALCATSAVALRHTHGEALVYTAAAGVLAVTLALHAALRRGPLSARTEIPPHSSAASWTCWLIGYTLLGDGLLRTAVTGGPDSLPDGTAAGDWPLTLAPVVALALSCGPAAWTAHVLAARVRRRLESSRGLEDFAASVRPLLIGLYALFLGAVAVLVTATSALLGEPLALSSTLALGGLLFLARLLTIHGFTHAPKVILTLTAAAQLTALATLFTARLPGCDALATPLQTLTALWSPAALPTVTCGAASLLLLIHTTRKLPQASTHIPQEQPR